MVGASLVAQLVKNLPAMQETQVQSLGHEDPLEKGMATCSSILAWEIPWTKEPSGLQSMGSQKLDTTERLSLSFFLFFFFFQNNKKVHWLGLFYTYTGPFFLTC